MSQRDAKLILLESLTPLHPGSGRGSAYVDLPVQRDEFDFPTIWSSSLKGALRSTLTLSCNGINDAVERVKCRRKVYLVFDFSINNCFISIDLFQTINHINIFKNP